MKKLLLSFCLFLTACAMPQSQPHMDSAAPPRVRSGLFTASDGARLPYREWIPKGKPEAVIVALHGFNDYSNAFEVPGRYMRRHGIMTLAYDQRGFGSTPARGVWAGEANLVRDAAEMVRAMRARYPDTPLYLLGESMGGAVAIAAVNYPGFPSVDGLILSAPALWGGDTLNPMVRATLWLAAHSLPEKTLTGKHLHILASDNIAMLRALGADPLVIKATRIDAIYGMVRIMDTAYTGISKVPVPVLILYGAHDQVIPPGPVRVAIRKAPKDATIAYYPHGHHMLMRDLHGKVPMDDILAWIDDPDSPLPSGHEVDAQKFLK